MESVEIGSSGTKSLLEWETHNNSTGKMRSSGQNKLFGISVSETTCHVVMYQQGSQWPHWGEGNKALERRSKK